MNDERVKVYELTADSLNELAAKQPRLRETVKGLIRDAAIPLITRHHPT